MLLLNMYICILMYIICDIPIHILYIDTCILYIYSYTCYATHKICDQLDYMEYGMKIRRYYLWISIWKNYNFHYEITYKLSNAVQRKSYDIRYNRIIVIIFAHQYKKDYRDYSIMKVTYLLFSNGICYIDVITVMII